MSFLKKHYGLFLVLILSFWAIQPFLISGFFPMHDDTQVARVFEMGKMLKEGVFPVRWVPDLGYGYGYPIFNFYAPLAYYVGGLFILLGFDALLATKLMMVLGVVLAGVFMYFLAREFFGELGGAVSGLFYVYAPYHAVDVYIRGDVAEFWAYAFIPLMFLGFYKVYKNMKIEVLELDNSKFKIQNSKLQFKIQKFGVVGALGFAGVILSHNLTALMVTPFLIIACLSFIIFSKKEIRIRTTLYLILYTFLGLAISAFYWAPALLEMKSTNVLSQIGGGADFRDHFVCLGQLWDSLWGFGGSVAGCVDGLSFKIGKLHILSVPALISILIYLRFKQKNFNNIYYLSILSSVGLLVSIFLMLEVSRFVWEAIPAMAFFQYPWRFLILVSFFSSILSGAVVFLLSQFRIKSYITAFLLVFFLLFFNIKLFVPQATFQAVVNDFTNERVLKWVASRISDEYLPPDFKKPKNQNDVYRGQISVKPQETNIEKISNTISLIGASVLVVGIIGVWKNRRKIR